MIRNSAERGNSRGTKAMRIENAVVEDVFVGNRGDGYILVSRGVPGVSNMLFKELFRLNVSRSTKIRNSRGRNINLRYIDTGMRINAIYSSAVTRSIPPQAEAYEITVLAETMSAGVTIDRVVYVDTRNNYFITGNPRNPEDQIKFVVNDRTVIRDHQGRRIWLGDLQAGQMVKVEYSGHMTSSIPPQTAAYRVQIITKA